MTPLFWRHPKPIGAEGRCIGRTDLAVDTRKAKRLALRIEHTARGLPGLPRIVVTSPLQRCAAVGRALAQRGWRHRLDPLLQELDFGRWDGRRWDDIPRDEVDAWALDLAHHRPGDGECVAELLHRVRHWQPEGAGAVVAHAGWLQARAWLAMQPEDMLPTADRWPGAIGYARRAG